MLLYTVVLLPYVSLREHLLCGHMCSPVEGTRLAINQEGQWGADVPRGQNVNTRRHWPAKFLSALTDGTTMSAFLKREVKLLSRTEAKNETARVSWFRRTLKVPRCSKFRNAPLCRASQLKCSFGT